MESDAFIEFPFQYDFYPELGWIFNPVVPIFLKTVWGWKEFEFVVDTGADLTTLPRRFVGILGIETKKCSKGVAGGIGGLKAKTWETKIPIRINDYEVMVRISIMKDDKTPLLLGRVGLLDDKFSWLFDAKKKKIIFEEI